MQVDPVIGVLLNAGVAGAVLWYVLTRINPTLDGLRQAIDENTRAVLLVTISSAREAELRRVAERQLTQLGGDIGRARSHGAPRSGGREDRA